MKNGIIVNGVKYNITGQWSINGFTHSYIGVAESECGGDNIPINCSIPISLIQEYGIGYFEGHIEKSFEDYLKVEHDKAKSCD